MQHVVMYSGGVSSWACAKRVAARFGTDNLTLLFCDTKGEDEDTYRFMRESAANVGGRLVEIADGRTIWEVFRAERFLGNSRIDPCSKILKRVMADRWLRDHYAPDACTVYVGIDWTESHRYERLAPRKLPWIYEAPLLEAPYFTKEDLHLWGEREGLRRQRLYLLGMSHANCGGGCVKAGIGHWSQLWQVMPDRYLEWEANEALIRDELGDVSILRRQGENLTLRQLRIELEAGYQPDLFEIGGCGCMIDEQTAPEVA